MDRFQNNNIIIESKNFLKSQKSIRGLSLINTQKQKKNMTLDFAA